MKAVRTALLAMLLLSACSSSQVNRENFEKIRMGMSQTEVIALLGEPDDVQTVTFGEFSGTSAKWSGSNGTIAIQFLNGRAQAKQFSKGKNQQ